MHIVRNFRYRLSKKLRPVESVQLYQVIFPGFGRIVRYNITDAVLPASKVSSNILFSIDTVRNFSFFETIQEPKLEDITLRFVEICKVSDNLFEPLLGDRAEGKRYDKEADRQQQMLFAEEEIKAFAKRTRGIRKAYWEHGKGDTTTAKHQTIWDLILPILQPPLNFDFPQELDIPSALYPFQMKGIEKLIGNEIVLLADEMGTGKTVMSVVSLRILFQQGKVARALIVCPLSAIGVWDEHLYEWAPQLAVTVVRGNKVIRRSDWANAAHVYLTTYDTFRNDSPKGAGLVTEDILKKIDLVILDEAQYIKNPRSGRSQAARMLNSRWRWALTGTPIENRLEDLVSIFDFLKPHHLEVIGLTPRKAKELIEPFFLRRRKKDVMKELPPKIHQDEWLELDEHQRRVYDEVENRGRLDIEEMGEKVTRVHIFALIQKLKQICNFAPGEDRGSKIDALLDHVEEIVESGNKVLIFSQYVQEGTEKLGKILYKYGVAKYGSGMTDRKRKEIVKEFGQDPKKQIFLSTVKTGGVSLTLTEASYVIHFDHWWNPAVAWQAEDRAHRMGQEQPVNIYSFWMRDTIEERIHDILKRKGLLHKEVIDGLSEKDIDKMVTMDEWLEMIGIKDKAKFKVRKKEEEVESDIAQILAKLQSLEPETFEEVVKDLFIKIGFKKAKTTKRTRDGGIDILASRLTIGGEENVVAQCKRRKDVLGVTYARELLGVVSGDPTITKGFLIASGFVSNDCKAFCKQQGQLSCIDGPELANYIKEFKIDLE